MRRRAIPFAGLAGAAAMASVASGAQDTTNNSWTRTSPNDQSFSVEVPCDAGQVARDTTRISQEIGQDERSFVACDVNGTVYIAYRVGLSSDVPIAEPLLEQIREYASSAGVDNQTAFTESIVRERRVVSVRETYAANLVRQTNVIELSDRQILMVGAGTANRFSSPALEGQVARFLASVVIAP
jgi:hypothetical protein